MSIWSVMASGGWAMPGWKKGGAFSRRSCGASRLPHPACRGGAAARRDGVLAVSAQSRGEPSRVVRGGGGAHRRAGGGARCSGDPGRERDHPWRQEGPQAGFRPRRQGRGSGRGVPARGPCGGRGLGRPAWPCGRGALEPHGRQARGRDPQAGAGGAGIAALAGRGGAGGRGSVAGPAHRRRVRPGGRHFRGFRVPSGQCASSGALAA